MNDKPECVCPDSPCLVHSGTYRFDRAKRFGRPNPLGYYGDSGPDPLRPEASEIVEQVCSSDGTVIAQKINGRWIDVSPDAPADAVTPL